MNYLEEFLRTNGLSLKSLDNQTYIIKSKSFSLSDKQIDLTDIEGLKLTGNDKEDAIVMFDLLVKSFFIQWNVQYKSRKYQDSNDSHDYYSEVEIKGFECNVIKRKGYGLILTEKKLNLLLIKNFASILEFTQNNEILKDNKYYEKLANFLNDIPQYIDWSLVYNPIHLRNSALEVFFKNDIRHLNILKDAGMSQSQYDDLVESVKKFLF
jgi:hypothetical protein